MGCRQAVSELARDTGSDDDRPLVPGDAVGRYIIESTIGSGGMGVVYLAHDPELDRKVAIKLWRSRETTLRAQSEQRLRLEARTLAQLAHPNVVGVYEVGVFDQRLFLAMEYVRGQTLAAWRSAGHRSVREILDVLVQAGEGLAAAHVAGIIHRDLKPSNVQVGADGRVRVVDFGLAQAIDPPPTPTPTPTEGIASASASTTSVGSVVGTPAYMAPEQREFGVANHKTDQFAFCVTAHELLTGHRPGERKGLRPSRLARVIARGLADDPTQRFASMHELVGALRAVRRAPRRRVIGAAIAAAAVVGAVGASWMTGRAPERDCAALADLPWGPTVRQRLLASFVGVGTALEQQQAARAVDRLDVFFGRWGEAARQACQAGRSGASSCLTQIRTEAIAQIEALRSIDAQSIGNVPAAVRALGDISECQRRAHPVPISAFTLQLAQAKALRRLGQHAAAVPILEAVLEASQDDRTRAAAWYQLGSTAFVLGKHALAEQQLVAATQAADRSGDDRTRAYAAVGLVSVIGTGLDRREEAEQWARAAEGAIGRLGDDAPVHLRLRFHNEWGRALHNDPVAARKQFDLALAIAQAEIAEDDPMRASTMLMVAQSLEPTDPEALRLLQAALDLIVMELGRDHPKTTFYLSELAAVRFGRGEFAEALALFEETVTIEERAFGPDYPDTGIALLNIARVHLARGDRPAARAAVSRAYAILLKAYGKDDKDVQEALELTRKLGREPDEH